ncbi:hypothetical protein SteCoe_697 [Stentor coeruleus]|uniref:Uncharacterized protein n=1 Tax=Stentor coeruleus TaxID=5963 RepID=A0A1R2D3G8_9CILI|nr:hypothetical protein SteCoe_697 [Stentor coeruleus]
MRLRRAIGNYPYHKFSRSQLSSLQNFPLILNSEPDIEYDWAKIFNEYEGFAKVFQIFMESFAHGKYKTLDNLAEVNLLARLANAWEPYNSAGYSMSLIGNPESIKITSIAHHNYIGTFFPFRNLNLPTEYYKFRNLNFDERFATSFTIAEIRDIKYPKASFSDFNHLDLEKINKEYSLSSHKEEILKLKTHMKKFPLLAWIIDIGILSNYKIIIKDLQGKVAYGNEDDKEEFHSMRLEYVREFPSIGSFFTSEGTKAKKFYMEKLGSHYKQYTIVDIDGFVDKNLIIA